jgi:hypothetical protein
MNSRVFNSGHFALDFTYYVKSLLTAAPHNRIKDTLISHFKPFSAQMWPLWQFPHPIQKYTKFANFARLCFPHFTTIRDQTLQF